MIKYKILDFFIDTLGYLYYRLTNTLPDDGRVYDAIVNDDVHIFKLYWQHSNKESIPELFKRVGWFKAHKILKVLISDGALDVVLNRDYMVELSKLFGYFDDRRARKMIRMLISNRPSIVTDFAEFLPMAMVEASSCEEPSGLKYLRSLNEREFDEYVPRAKADALFQHIRMNNEPMVKTMLRYGFDVHTCGDTVLSVATRGGNMRIIKALCDYGADISGDSYHAVSKAVARKNTELVVFYAKLVWPKIAEMPYGTALKMLGYLLRCGQLEFTTEEINETISIIKDYHDRPSMI